MNKHEQTNKTLTLLHSTGAEATIDIDSLYEGIDYNSKISRARYEDLLTIPIIQLKKMITGIVEKSKTSASSVEFVCLSGGPSSMPKVLNTIKAMFPSAKFIKGKFEVFEGTSIGAAVHGKFLHQMGLIDSAPQASHTGTAQRHST